MTQSIGRRVAILGATVALLLITGLTPAPAAANIYVYETDDGRQLVTSERRSDLNLVRVIEGSNRGTDSPTNESSSSGDAQNEHSAGLTTREKSERRAERAKQKAKRNGKLGNRNVPRTAAYDDLIQEASEAYDVPFSFIKAVIRVESNFRRFATSHAGAMGLMQLMPATAEGLSVTDPFDPRQNIYGGTKLLRQLIDRYNGDINLVLSAYNAGGVAVARYDGIPFSQTREYVASVVRWYRYYKKQRGQEDAK